MATFQSELLNNNVSADVAWRKITSALQGGAKSVEVVSRVINGEDKWELRSWSGLRKDKSNGAKASPNQDY